MSLESISNDEWNNATNDGKGWGDDHAQGGTAANAGFWTRMSQLEGLSKGVRQDYTARALGYADHASMQQAIAATQKANKSVRRTTDQIVADWYANPFNEKGIQTVEDMRAFDEWNAGGGRNQGGGSVGSSTAETSRKRAVAARNTPAVDSFNLLGPQNGLSKSGRHGLGELNSEIDSFYSYNNNLDINSQIDSFQSIAPVSTTPKSANEPVNEKSAQRDALAGFGRANRTYTQQEVEKARGLESLDTEIRASSGQLASKVIGFQPTDIINIGSDIQNRNANIGNAFGSFLGLATGTFGLGYVFDKAAFEAAQLRPGEERIRNKEGESPASIVAGRAPFSSDAFGDDASVSSDVTNGVPSNVNGAGVVNTSDRQAVTPAVAKPPINSTTTNGTDDDDLFGLYRRMLDGFYRGSRT